MGRVLRNIRSVHWSPKTPVLHVLHAINETAQFLSREEVNMDTSRACFYFIHLSVLAPRLSARTHLGAGQSFEPSDAPQAPSAVAVP
jgi:hypothetical protein